MQSSHPSPPNTHIHSLSIGFDAFQLCTHYISTMEPVYEVWLLFYLSSIRSSLNVTSIALLF